MMVSAASGSLAETPKPRHAKSQLYLSPHSSSFPNQYPFSTASPAPTQPAAYRGIFYPSNVESAFFKLRRHAFAKQRALLEFRDFLNEILELAHKAKPARAKVRPKGFYSVHLMRWIQA